MLVVFYAGIGSRETPPDVLKKMSRISQFLSSKGFVLRSGGAPGADQSFEQAAGKKIIFRPKDVTPQATAVAKRFLPVFDGLTQQSRDLLARNALIILGERLSTPVSFVVCWTPDGEAIGGTGHSIRIARSKRIPVFNLANQEDEEDLPLFVAQLLIEKGLRDLSEAASEKSDGVSHINVYSAAKTKLGMFLSNFYECKIITEIGVFSSVEGLWYYLSTNHKDKEKLRNLSGSEAKSQGQMMKMASRRFEPRFKEIISSAIEAKIKSSDVFSRELTNSNLPLTHYYIFKGIKKVPDKHFWVIALIESIRTQLKVERAVTRWVQHLGREVACDQSSEKT